MPRDTISRRPENPQVHTRAVILVAAAILAALTAVAFGLMPFFPERIGVRYVVRHRFPSPAVIPSEGEQRRALEAAQRKALEGGSGRLSITEAMKEIAARKDRALDPVGP